MTSPGGPSGRFRSSMAASSKAVKSATPARAALARLMRMAPASWSRPKQSAGGGETGPAARKASQAAASKVASFSKAKLRERPGFKPAAISAASMTKVPEPHMGSRTGSWPEKPHWRRKSAAIVSRIGAFATSSLKPRLCSGSPDVSTAIVQRSFSIRALMTTSASSLTGTPSSPEIARAMRSAAAPE